MTRLTTITYLWRNYLYANRSGYFNDADGFLTRMSLIRDSKEEILNQILSTMPDQAMIEAAKEEIEYQLDMMKDMVEEYSQYVEKYHIFESPEECQKYFLEDLVTNEYFYTVAFEWKEYADNALEVIQGMRSCSIEVDQWNYLMDSLLELQDLDGKKNFDCVRQELKEKEMSGNETEGEGNGLKPKEDFNIEDVMKEIKQNGPVRCVHFR